MDPMTAMMIANLAISTGEKVYDVVDAAIEHGLARTLAAGKAPGILAVDETLARRCIELGARFVAVGVEAMMLAQATRSLLQRFKPTKP